MNLQGVTRAPNGATYSLVPPHPIFGRHASEWSVLVAHPGHPLRRIVGWNGETFASRSAAEAWADMDGRYELAPGKTIEERRNVEDLR